VKWEKLNDSKWYPIESQQRGSILTIDSYREDDFGEYRCSSRNSIGQSEIEMNLSSTLVSIDDESVFKPFSRAGELAGARKLHQRRKSGLEARKSRFRSRMRKMRRFKQKKSLNKKKITANNNKPLPPLNTNKNSYLYQ
jgi:hypothetical protein